MAGCAIALTGLFFFVRLPPAQAAPPRARTLPRSPFVLRFLAVFAVWHFATGAFNPFFNAFLSRHLHASSEQIGTIFSAAQVAQVAAIFCAPLVLKRCGLIRGVVGMQVATALALATAGWAPAGLLAATGYCGYMAFQYMSEPGTFSLLMDGVRPEERAGASALNFVIAFAAQGLAAAAAGSALYRFGYRPVLSAASVVMLLAAVLLAVLLGPLLRTSADPTA